MKNNWSNFLQENFIGDSDGILSTMNEEDALWYVVDFLFQDNPTHEKYTECESVVKGNKFSAINEWRKNNLEIKYWLKVIREVESMINDKSLLNTRIVYHWNFKYLNTFKRKGVTYNPDMLEKAFKIAEKGLSDVLADYFNSKFKFGSENCFYSLITELRNDHDALELSAIALLVWESDYMSDRKPQTFSKWIEIFIGLFSNEKLKYSKPAEIRRRPQYEAMKKVIRFPF